MRIVRYLYRNKKPAYGWLLEDKIGSIKGDVFGSFQRGEAKIPFLVPSSEERQKYPWKKPVFFARWIREKSSVRLATILPMPPNTVRQSLNCRFYFSNHPQQ